MFNRRWALVWLLRATGIVMLTALVFVFCPFSWMAKLASWAGVAEQLVYSPLMSYLTRTLSAMYAMMGAMLLFVSFDIDRYMPLVRLLAWLGLVGGAGVTFLDWLVAMPLFWTIGEGLGTVLLGVAMVYLTRPQNCSCQPS